MTYKYDIFISYAHIDNRTMSEEQEGWIDFLHRALAIRLAQILGREPRIWRDPKLQGNDFFNEEIIEELSKASALVSVISPRYIRSEWCLKEIEQFINMAQKNGGIRVENKSRIFKVIKTPVPYNEHPPAIRDMLGTEFFSIDPTTNRPREFRRGFGAETDPQFWLKLDDLAYEIRQLLEMLEKKQTGDNIQNLVHVKETVQPSGLTVFLAETTRDLDLERQHIRRALEARGHTVLPDQKLPRFGPSIEELVRDNLKQCHLSVHMAGSYYSFIPEAEEARRSVIQLQNDLAAEYRKEHPDFAHVIWTPTDLEIKDQDQQSFISTLYDNPQGADLLKTTLEELKTIIEDKLIVIAQTLADDKIDLPTEQARSRLYLICSQQDRDNIIPLEDYLYDELGFEVYLPLFEEDNEAAVSKEHRHNLRDCDAALIYYGQVKEAWLRGKVRDLRKAQGYGRKQPIKAKAIFVGPPKDDHKFRYRTHDVDEVIKNFGPFAPDRLTPFLTRIETGQEGHA